MGDKPTLIMCEVCDGKVASNANTCPHCGAPNTQSIPVEIELQDDSMESWVTAVVWSGFIAVCVFFGMQIWMQNTDEYKQLEALSLLAGGTLLTEYDAKIFDLSLKVAIYAFVSVLDNSKDVWIISALWWAMTIYWIMIWIKS